MKYTGVIISIAIVLFSSPFAILDSILEHGFPHAYDIPFTLAALGAAVWLGRTFDKFRALSHKLQEITKEFEDILNNDHGTLWSFNLRKQQFTVSAGVEKTYNLERDTFSKDKSAWIDMVYPKDRYIAVNLQKDLLEGKAFNFEYRVEHNNDEIRWVKCIGHPVTDKEGNVVKVTGVLVDISDLKKAEEALTEMAYYDALTGLPNRNLLFVELKKWIEEEQNLTVMFIDLDRFKTVNDSLGHRIGDQLLQCVSARMNKCVKESGAVFRYGGDEFIVLLHGSEPAQVEDVAQRIIDSFSEPVFIDSYEVFSSPSIGICFFEEGFDGDTLIKNADSAMYLAKEKGKNNFQFYSSHLNETIYRKMIIENGLRKAIEHNELFIQYQPQVDLSNGGIFGVEALVRWNHGELGIISPGEFIPIAEETGLIIPIGQWVLETACRQNKAWQEAGFEPIRIGVNISARQFQHKDFIQNIIHTLQITGLEPRYLDLEITESLMQNIKELQQILNNLKELGVKISIDDFGTGYSSLGVLKKLPIDHLKIDQSFVHDVITHTTESSLVKMIIDMGYNLNMTVIAEGIENNAQLSFLKKFRCHVGQGYLFSKPLSLPQMETLLREVQVKDGILVNMD